ncbi:TPA: hypothetical protein ACF31N_001179 [Vibrio parahaemolyticus]
MPNETNVYSRNLKVISIFYIVYWLLGLHPNDNTLALGPVRFTIENPHLLPSIANGLLLYFAWRFYIHSQKKVRISYNTFFRSEMLHQKHKFWCKKLYQSAGKHFEQEGFKDLIENKLGENTSDYKREDFKISIQSLQNSNTPTFFEYRYRVNPHVHKSANPKIYEFSFGFNPFLKVLMHINLFSYWVISKEEAADYLLPWLLFGIAVVSIFLRGDYAPDTAPFLYKVH